MWLIKIISANTKGLGVYDNTKGDIKANNICSYTFEPKSRQIFECIHDLY